MQRNVCSCRFILESVRHFFSEFPLPHSRVPRKKSHITFPALQCSFGAVLALFDFKSEVSDPLSFNLVFREEKKSTKRQKHEHAIDVQG